MQGIKQRKINVRELKISSFLPFFLQTSSHLQSTGGLILYLIVYYILF